MTRDLLDLMGDTGQPPKTVSADAAPAPESAPLKSEHVELDLVLHYDNEVKGEILVSKNGNECEAIWLRKDQVQCASTGKTVPAFTQGKHLARDLEVVALNIPEWLARQKGLI